MSDVEPEQISQEPEREAPEKAVPAEKPAEKETKPKKAAVDPAVSIKLSKKMIWILSVVAVLAVAGVAVWQFKWYQPVADWYNQGSVEIKVKEDGKYAIEGAKLTVNGNSYTTNRDGKVSLAKLIAGSYQVRIEKDGFTPGVFTLTTHRQDNPQVVYSLSKVPEKLFTIQGKVQDYVSNRPLADVEVTFNNKTVVSDSNGNFSFAQVVPKSYVVTFAKSGYTTKQPQLVVSDKNVTMETVSLVPAGQIVFVSNREGKKYLYAAAYDGSAAHPFVDVPANGEDFSLQRSPNGKSYTFASTRNKITDAYGQELVQLFTVGEDGKNPHKLSDDVDRYFSPMWSPDSTWAYSSGYTTSKMDKRTFKLFNLSNNQVVEVGEEVVQAAFSPDSTWFLYQTFGKQDNPSATSGQSSTVTVNQLKLINLKTGERKQLVQRTDYLNEVQFSTDGKTAIYEIIQDNAKHRFSVTIDGTPAEQEIAVPAAQRRRLVASPDGSHYVFVEQRDGKMDVFMVDKNQKNEIRLTTSGTANDQFSPRWDATGKYIIYAVKREAENALYIVSTDGGDSKKITDYYAEDRYDYGYGY